MDALVIGSDEGRCSMRKASVSLQVNAISRRCPNGETCLILLSVVIWIHRVTILTRRTETSKYPKEYKSNEISIVVASEFELADFLIFIKV